MYSKIDNLIVLCRKILLSSVEGRHIYVYVMYVDFFLPLIFPLFTFPSPEFFTLTDPAGKKLELSVATQDRIVAPRLLSVLAYKSLNPKCQWDMYRKHRRIECTWLSGLMDAPVKCTFQRFSVSFFHKNMHWKHIFA